MLVAVFLPGDCPSSIGESVSLLRFPVKGMICVCSYGVQLMMGGSLDFFPVVVVIKGLILLLMLIQMMVSLT